MTALLPRLLGPDVLPLAELMALCLDGQLYRVGDSFATLDTPESAELRAHAFTAQAPPFAIADRGTAAWIHGARASPPARLQVCVDTRNRGGRVSTDFDSRQSTFARGDVQRIGAARVTSPERTALDLICADGRFPPDTAAQVRHLLGISGVSVAALRSRMRASPRWGARRSLARVDRLTALAEFAVRPRRRAQPAPTALTALTAPRLAVSPR